MKNCPVAFAVLTLLLAPGTISRAGGVIVSTGYYDLTPAQFPGGLPVPNPWYGSPNTTFYGNVGQATSSDPDEDAVLLQNTGTTALTLQALTIGSGTINLFAINGVTSPVTLAANSYTIFAGVDGSDESFGPVVNFTLNGQSFSFSDPTGSGYASGVLHGYTVFGNADETIPWTVGFSPVPEPATITMLSIGLVGVVAACLYRSRNCTAA